MTRVINKQCCPTCGQSTNIREITLFSGMVDGLKRVFEWCERTGRWSGIRRQELEHCLNGASESHRFHDWKIFAPQFVGGSKKGRYNFDREAILAFLLGKTQVPTIIERNPLTGTDTPKEFRTITGIPKLSAFLDENQEFTVRYIDAPVSQAA